MGRRAGSVEGVGWRVGLVAFSFLHWTGGGGGGGGCLCCAGVYFILFYFFWCGCFISMSYLYYFNQTAKNITKLLWCVKR